MTIPASAEAARPARRSPSHAPIERNVPPHYVDRPDVKAPLQRALTRDNHVILFGDPGQGKTTMLRDVLTGIDHIFVQCRSKQRIPDLYRSILFEAGASITIERKMTKRKRMPASVRFAPTDDTVSTESLVTVDLGNICDVVRILRSVFPPRWIVLNDFQALAYGAQRALARDMRYLAENSVYRFVIVGAWSGAARFLDLNEDAAGTVSQTHVRPWTRAELSAAADRVTALNEVRFSSKVSRVCLDWSVGSIRNLHEIVTRLSAFARDANPAGSLFDDVAAARQNIEDIFGRPFAKYDELIREFAELPMIKATNAQLLTIAEAPRYYSEDEPPSAAELKRRTGVLRARLNEWNAKKRERIVLRRALLLFLATRDWTGLPAACTMADFSRFVAERSKGTLTPTRKQLEKAIAKFVEFARAADITPDPLEYDKVDTGIRLVDQKLRVFLARRRARGIRALFADVVVPPDEYLKYW